MVVLFCILFVISLCHCNDLPSKTEIESSINRTIDEVERLIRQNSTLPNLTRHEIIDILFNITSKNLETYENKSIMEEARNIYQNALMVVLPYNAEDSRENIKDLYIKPPIVQIIADPFPNPEDFEAEKNKKLEANILVQEMHTQHDKKKQSLENFVVTYAPKENLNEEHTYNPEQTQLYRNHKEMYSKASSKVPMKETLNDSAPIKFSFNLENLQKREREQPTITEKQITTYKQPMFQGSSLRKIKDKEVYIVYSTGATTIPPRTVETKKYISMFNLEPLSSEKENEIISRPLKYNENVLSVDQWRYNASKTQKERESTTILTKLDETDTLFKRIRDKQQLFPTSITQMPLKNIAPTNKIKYIPESLTSEKIQIVNAESAPIFVTPMPLSSLLPSSSSTLPARKREKLKYNSTYIYNLNSGFRKIITTTMRPEVMELLASIGLRPENATNVEDVFRKSNKDLEIKSRIPNSNDLIYTTSSLTTVLRDSSPINAQNTFENPVLEIGKGMNNLTPDVQLLFQKFGLQSNLVTTSSPLKISNTNSYTNFKPLPTSKIKNEDMKEFLAKFGLGVSDNRQKKAMSISTERPSLIEVIPNNMRQILENIGLISRKTSKTISKMESVELTKTTQQFHVFKPHEAHVKDKGERMKINELLDKIRLVQEGKASAKDVRKVADNLLATTKTLKDGPDPLSLEEMIKTYNINVKNEVKRQQNLKETIETTTNDDRALSAPTESANISSTTTTMATIPTTSDSTKDSSNFRDTLTPTAESSTFANTNLAALEESFGGTTRAPDPVLPTKQRNGLYFLLDWNTFLEVGDEESEKVNLRFEPKIGDRMRFLPVSVP
ncbi:PREDICTED: uncharacterized protein LOC108693389 [Atta colombica]|uniref:uncharacterized protein LOC108693389 n=1 Tax=Atta colombica TaxID=520822 RepID=UPI00084CE5CC|nr:PREDICTED: uncharacterized protein LOC108693389 [Atta colombica]